MKKLKYIKHLEKELGILSIIDFGGEGFSSRLINIINGYKFEQVFRKTFYDIYNNKMRDKSIIYKTKQNFYIQTVSIDQYDGWDMKIYYKPEQYNELFIFCNKLLDIYKNNKYGNN